MNATPHIFQINASNGGVPKRPLPTAEITSLGIEGDFQKNKKYHGGPQRALCLYALEHIVALQAESHPIYPGAIGENITIVGLPWAQLTPGVRLQLGPTVQIEISSYTVPCRTIQGAFKERKFGRVSQKSNPGWSRLYAQILQPGTITISDPIWILPAEETI